MRYHACSKRFLDIQSTIECGFTLKRVRDMIRTCNQMHRTDKYLQHSAIIWSVWLNGPVPVYKLSGCAFESHCIYVNFRYYPCFEKGVPWHSGNYRMSVHSETHTWHDKDIQSDNLQFSFSVFECSSSHIIHRGNRLPSTALVPHSHVFKVF